MEVVAMENCSSEGSRRRWAHSLHMIPKFHKNDRALIFSVCKAFLPLRNFTHIKLQSQRPPLTLGHEILLEANRHERPYEPDYIF
jgi:hypothetical protein